MSSAPDRNTPRSDDSGQAYPASPDPASRLGLGRIGSYRIVGEVARGGMGVVYRGVDERLQRPVAVKLLLAPGARGLDDRRVRRFSREAQALGGLAHPGLLAVYDFGVLAPQQIPYMITEWLEGQSLEERLSAGVLPVREAVDLVEAIARAVAHAHERGILHRDLKPSNVVLSPRGPVVIDFGLAKRQDGAQSRLTQSGTMAGTTGYAAPEQLRDAAHVDERADVYGLGATLYALLTGFPPGGHTGQAVELYAASATGKYPRASELRPEVPLALDRVLAHAMAPDPAARIAGAEGFADALGRLEAPTKGRRLAWAWGAGLALLTLLGAGVGLALRGTSPESAPSPAASREPAPSAAVSPKSPPLASPAPESTEDEERQLARLYSELPEAPVEAAALEQLYGRGLPVARALVRAAGTSARWAGARFLGEGGAFREAQAALGRVREDPAYRARAALEEVFLILARGAEAERDPSEALAEAFGAGGAGRPAPSEGEERFAWRLLRLAEGFLQGPEPGLPGEAAVVAARDELRAIAGAARGPWQARALWGVSFFCLIQSPPQLRTVLAEAWSKGELALPGWSTLALQIFAIPNRDYPLLSDEFAGLVAAHEARIESPALWRAVATSAAVAGSLGELELALAHLPGSPEARELRRSCQAIASGRAGRVIGELAGEGWLRVRFEPSASTLGLWLRVPADAPRWRLRLAGAEVDFDLRARRGGPPQPGRSYPHESMTMARDERLEGSGGGLYFVQIERSTPWPQILELSLELSLPALGSSEAAPVDPWEVPQVVVPLAGLGEAFRSSRQLFAAGETDRALDVLEPFCARSQRAEYVRWSLLDFAARWETLAREVEPALSAGAERGRLARWLAGRAAISLGDYAAGIRHLQALVDQAPELQVAWESYALACLAQNQPQSARRALREARRRFPRAPSLELLELSLRGASLDPSFAGRFRQLQGHAVARRVGLGCLFFRRSHALTLSLVEGLEPELRALPRQQIYRACAFYGLGRAGEARVALEAVDLRALPRHLERSYQQIRAAVEEQLRAEAERE